MKIVFQENGEIRQIIPANSEVDLNILALDLVPEGVAFEIVKNAADLTLTAALSSIDFKQIAYDEKIKEAKKLRNDAINTGEIFYKDHGISVDEKTRVSTKELYDNMKHYSSEPVNYFTNNGKLELMIVDIEVIRDLMSAFVKQTFTKYELHFDALEVLLNDETKTADDIKKYDINLGW